MAQQLHTKTVHLAPPMTATTAIVSQRAMKLHVFCPRFRLRLACDLRYWYFVQRSKGSQPQPSSPCCFAGSAHSELSAYACAR
eukprot:12061846-Karenia_brevis.AAC.1